MQKNSFRARGLSRDTSRDRCIQGKIQEHKWYFLNVWNTLKRPKLRIHGVEEEAEDEIKHDRQIFNKIVTKNFPNSENKELQIKMTREDTLHHTLYSDVRNTQ